MGEESEKKGEGGERKKQERFGLLEYLLFIHWIRNSMIEGLNKKRRRKGEKI